MTLPETRIPMQGHISKPIEPLNCFGKTNIHTNTLKYITLVFGQSCNKY